MHAILGDESSLTYQERKFQFIQLSVLTILPIVFGGTGYLLRSVEPFWSLFAWIGGGMLLVLLVSKSVAFIKDDYFRYKIIYKGILKEVQTVKMGYGTSSSLRYDLVFEKKTLKVSEKSLSELHLAEVPFPAQGEPVEIHTLPYSGDVLKLLALRNGEWKEVVLK